MSVNIGRDFAKPWDGPFCKTIGKKDIPEHCHMVQSQLPEAHPSKPLRWTKFLHIKMAKTKNSKTRQFLNTCNQKRKIYTVKCSFKTHQDPSRAPRIHLSETWSQCWTRRHSETTFLHQGLASHFLFCNMYFINALHEITKFCFPITVNNRKTRNLLIFAPFCNVKE